MRLICLSPSMRKRESRSMVESMLLSERDMVEVSISSTASTDSGRSLRERKAQLDVGKEKKIRLASSLLAVQS